MCTVYVYAYLYFYVYTYACIYTQTSRYYSIWHVLQHQVTFSNELNLPPLKKHIKNQKGTKTKIF